jgi:predicted nucleic acid-binding protein
MAARYVVDTNVLVYALDRREPEKRERARDVLRRVGGAGIAALPAQVLSEFGGACSRKLEPRPDPTTVRREVERLMLAFPVLLLTGPVVLTHSDAGWSSLAARLRLINRRPRIRILPAPPIFVWRRLRVDMG